jgi:hypothetical protein
MVCSLSLHLWDCELLEHVRVNDVIDRFLNEERSTGILEPSSYVTTVHFTDVLNIASSESMIRFKNSCFPLALHNILVTNWFVSRLDCALELQIAGLKFQHV